MDCFFAEYDYIGVAEALAAEWSCWVRELDMASLSGSGGFITFGTGKASTTVDIVAWDITFGKPKEIGRGQITPEQLNELLRLERLARFKAALTSDDSMPEFHP